jgi:hypothetical protein
MEVPSTSSAASAYGWSEPPSASSSGVFCFELDGAGAAITCTSIESLARTSSSSREPRSRSPQPRVLRLGDNQACDAMAPGVGQKRRSDLAATQAQDGRPDGLREPQVGLHAPSVAVAQGTAAERLHVSRRPKAPPDCRPSACPHDRGAPRLARAPRAPGCACARSAARPPSVGRLSRAECERWATPAGCGAVGGFSQMAGAAASKRAASGASARVDGGRRLGRRKSGASKRSLARVELGRAARTLVSVASLRASALAGRAQRAVGAAL